MKNLIFISALLSISCFGCSETFTVAKDGNGGMGGETSSGSTSSGGEGSTIGTGGNVSTGGSATGGSVISTGGSTGSVSGTGGIIGTGGGIDPESKCAKDPNTYKIGYEIVNLGDTWPVQPVGLPNTTDFEKYAKTLNQSSETCGGGCFVSGQTSGWCPDSSYNMLLDCPLNNGNIAPTTEETSVHTIHDCVIAAVSETKGSAWCCIASAK